MRITKTITREYDLKQAIVDYVQDYYCLDITDSDYTAEVIKDEKGNLTQAKVTYKHLLKDYTEVKDTLLIDISAIDRDMQDSDTNVIKVAVKMEN